MPSVALIEVLDYDGGVADLPEMVGRRGQNQRAWRVPAKELLKNGGKLDRKNPNAKDDITHPPPRRTRRFDP